MSFIEAVILGIVQGLTEFLPVSSSGHLKLGQFLFGFDDLGRYVLFDLFCHLGTLLAVILVFRRDIIDLFGSKRSQLPLILLATLPLFPLVLVLKPLKHVINSPQYLGFFFLITAALLLAMERFAGRASEKCSVKPSFWSAVIIGCAQALAVLPGVSRSGSTISTACLLGWERREAARFSFIISIPAILGGTALELLQIWRGATPAIDITFSSYFAGFFLAFFSGYGALIYLLHLLEHGTLKGFAIYCIGLAALTFTLTQF